MATRTRARRGRPRRPGVELLEGRTLLNASIDVAADGSLVYTTDPTTPQSLSVSVENGVYTFAVDPADPVIVVTSNDAHLVVSGSGSTTVTVADPAVGMRIEAASAGQTIRVRSTGLPTVVDLAADSERVFLGAGPDGLRGLVGAVTVASTSPAFTSNSLTVDDGSAAYDPGVSPTYALTSTTIASPTAVGFGGIAYSGLATLTLKGTSNATADAALYQVAGTAGGVATTIDAGGGHAVVQVDSTRGANFGLNSNLTLQGGGGAIDVQVANFRNPGTPSGNPNWTLGFDPDAPSPFASLRDATNPNLGGLFFRPAEVHSLSVDAAGNRGASLLVDFSQGDPLPSGAAAGNPDDPQPGLTYVGAAGVGTGARYALAFTGTPPSGAFASEAHTVFPLYGGQIVWTEAGGATRNVAYRLQPSASLVDDSATAASYSWFYDIMHGAVDGQRTLPNGAVVSAKVDSTLVVGAATSTVTEGWGLGLAEANANAFLARYLVTGKTDVALRRGWSLGAVATVLNYAPTLEDGTAPAPGEVPPVVGLATLTIEDVSPPDQPTADVVQIAAAPPATSIFVRQNGGADTAIVKLTGLDGVLGVSLDGGTSNGPDGQPDKDALQIDADGLNLGPAGFVGLGPGAIQIPALSSLTATVTARNYEDVQVFNSSTPTFQTQPRAIAATAQVPLSNVVAGVLTVTLPGLTFAGMTPVIAWGDGQFSVGSVQAIPGMPGVFQVIGSHTYSRSGVFTPIIHMQGTSPAQTTVSDVPVTFQVAGASGTAATPPAVGVVLTPGSDSGISSSDLLTNVTRPTFAGTAAPGTWINLYAAERGGGGLILLGWTVADASGSWTIPSMVVLADGDYTIQAVSFSASSPANGVADLAGPLRIDTLGPVVWGVTVNPVGREVRIDVRDRGGAGDSGSAVYAANVAGNYAFTPAGVSSVLTAPPYPATSMIVSLRTIRPIRPAVHALTVLAGRDLATGLGIFDAAGNPLDGSFNGRFPSGGANAGQNFVAQLVIHGNRVVALRPETIGGD